MRFIRQTVLVSTVSDDELEDKQLIKNVLDNLSKASVSVKMSYHDVKSDVVKQYDVVRVLGVKDETVDIRSFCGAGSVVERGISFDSIREVSLTTSANNIIVGETKIPRASFLDI